MNYILLLSLFVSTNALAFPSKGPAGKVRANCTVLSYDQESRARELFRGNIELTDGFETTVLEDGEFKYTAKFLEAFAGQDSNILKLQQIDVNLTKPVTESVSNFQGNDGFLRLESARFDQVTGAEVRFSCSLN